MPPRGRHRHPRRQASRMRRRGDQAGGGPFQGPARLPLYQPDFKRSAFIRPNDVDVSRVVTLLFPSWIDVRFTASPLVSRVRSDASGVTASHASLLPLPRRTAQRQGYWGNPNDIPLA